MTYQETIQLASAAKVSIATARKWVAGGKVTHANQHMLEMAAASLGLQRQDPKAEPASES
jgi:hypothetical protein